MKISIGQKVGYISSYVEGKPATNHYSKDPGLVLLNNRIVQMLRGVPGRYLRPSWYKDGK